MCPAGSTGVVGGTSGKDSLGNKHSESGCTTDDGYHGHVTATTTDPYYTTDVAVCTKQTGCVSAMETETMAKFHGESLGLGWFTLFATEINS